MAEVAGTPRAEPDRDRSDKNIPQVYPDNTAGARLLGAGDYRQPRTVNKFRTIEHPVLPAGAHFTAMSFFAFLSKYDFSSEFPDACSRYRIVGGTVGGGGGGGGRRFVGITSGRAE